MLLRWWRILRLGASSFLLALRASFFIHPIISNSHVCFLGQLKDDQNSRVEVAIEYAKTIDDFDDLVNPRSRSPYTKTENSKLKKDLIVAMDEANTVNEKAKVLGDDLRVERQLTLEKDEQLQAAKEKIKTVATKAIEAF